MPKKILVVEDSPTQAQKAQLILESKGYQVSWAANGSEGLAKIATEKPDLIVTDIVMPQMDGYELCQRIKSSQELRDIPVVMLTTKDQVTDIVKGLGVGADNFITKPYESSHLITQIEKIFANLELRKKGLLVEEMELERLGDKIAITTDRQQILALMLSTIGVVIHCHVLALFLLKEKQDKHSLYLVSLQPLGAKARLDLAQKALNAACALESEAEITLENVRIKDVVKEEELPVLDEAFQSFISVPLISQGEIIGILTTGNTKEDAFHPDDVKLLYQVGLQSAEAFNHLGR